LTAKFRRKRRSLTTPGKSYNIQYLTWLLKADLNHL
jgi:hypothetical protein